MALIGASDYKTAVGITATTWDAQISALCTLVDSLIKAHVGLDIEATNYPGAATAGKGDSGLYSGESSRYLKVRQRPVRSVTSIYLDLTGRWDQNPDGSFASTTLLVEGTDYAIRKDGYHGAAAVSMSGIIEKLNGVWPALQVYQRGVIGPDLQTAQGNIKITYAGGWSTVPPDITAAAILWVSHLRRIAQAGGFLTSESLGGYSYSMAAPPVLGIPPDVAMILGKYKELYL